MLESFANGALAVLGISFLIFMHELGHFAAARMFRVRVETFSIGFGRRIAGFHRGGTDYRLSLVPLGGYVKMAGEYGDGEDGGRGRDDPGALTNKPIWQRLIIFSAGVIVNIALAFVIFPLAFGLGVPFMSPVIGTLVPGGPAWRAGAQVGDEIVAVDGTPVYGFSDVGLEVALADPDRTVLRVRRGDDLLDLALATVRLDDRWDAGVLPPLSDRLVVGEGGPAARAGLRNGDRLLAANGLAVGTLELGRPLGPGDVLSRARVGGAEFGLTVDRDGSPLSVTISPEPAEAGATRILGAQPLARRVEALRGDAASPSFPLQAGDVLLALDDRPILDAEALLGGTSVGPLRLTALRGAESRDLVLDAKQAASLLSGDVAFGVDRAHAFIQPIPGGALDLAGVQAGDRVVELDGEVLASYDALLKALETAREEGVVDHQLVLDRSGERLTIAVRTQPTPTFDDGLDLPIAEVRHELSLTGSLSAGVQASLNALRTTAATLGKLLTGSVGVKNLGGPLSISYITYRSAEWDFAKLLFFLALLSVNLGFINILPVPVLDGGQVVFLLCEKIKGSRLSDRFLQNAQLAGLVAILALMVVVTYNDILRFLG